MALSCEFEFTPAEGKISYKQLDTRDPKTIETSFILHNMITNAMTIKTKLPMVHYVALPPCFSNIFF